MNTITKLNLCAMAAFVTALLIGVPVIRLMKRLRAKQTVLQYVDNHTSKSGTPTMGGFIFLIPASVVTLAFSGFDNKFALVSVGVMLAFAAVGFLDDFIKIKGKQNLGLKPYQKIIAQVGVSAIVTWFAYKNTYIGSAIHLPFTDRMFEMQWWYLPVCFIAFIATVNAVNLTDGLDGLAGGTGAVYFGVFTVVLFIMLGRAENLGERLYADELLSLSYFSASIFGALLGFLWFNSNPASVFMGDTGSLSLGGAAATVAIFSKNPLLILLLGIMYVLSCISVIMQVLYFKATKKRIFLMAPFHHHLEYKGYKEVKIVAFYILITLFMGFITLASI